MARTAEQIESEIDTLESMLSKGILRTRHGDVEITYQNVTEMRARLADLKRDLAVLTKAPAKQIRFRTGKGL
jgi:hypothetical protein